MARPIHPGRRGVSNLSRFYKPRRDTTITAGTGTITYVTGVATETDPALAASRLKVLATTVPSETDAGSGAGRAHLRSTGPGPETDAGLPAGRSKARTTGVPAELDSGLPASRTHVRVTGAAGETDTGLPAGGLPVIVDVPAPSGGGWSAPPRVGSPQLPKPGTVVVTTGVACETDTVLPSTVISFPRRRAPGLDEEEELLMLGLL